MSSKEESNKSNKTEEHHDTMLESAKHVVDAVTESMFGTSSVFGVLVEPHSELTHPNEKTSSKSSEDRHNEEHHHDTLFESVKHAADSVTESMFESSSVYGVLVEPHPELTHPEERSLMSEKNEISVDEEHHSTVYEYAKKISDAVTGSMFESSSVYGVLVEPHPELLHEHEREVKDESKKESGKEDGPDRPWHHLM